MKLEYWIAQALFASGKPDLEAIANYWLRIHWDREHVERLHADLFAEYRERGQELKVADDARDAVAKTVMLHHG